MSGTDSGAVLQFVDLVLDDLRLRGRMFVARRPEAGESEMIVIFWTDRGRRVPPAWRLQADGVAGAIWVLDPAIASRATAPGEPPATPRPPRRPRGDPGTRVVLDSGGQTVSYSFTGAPPRYVQYPPR